MFNLIDGKYPLCSESRVGQRIKEQVQKQLHEKFPEKEGHLPEEERQGYIPDAVLKAITQSLRERPGSAVTGIHDNNATPAEAPDTMNAWFETRRPSVLFPDRDSRIIEPTGDRDIFALHKLSMLVAKTSVDLVDQWRTEFMALAFPFSIPRVVGGADYPWKVRFRRHREAAILTPWECTRMHARRVDSNLKSDWNLVPA